MTTLKEIVGYDEHKRQIIKFENPPANFPPLDKIYEISLVDHNGMKYAYRLLRNSSESAIDTLDETGEETLDETVEGENLSIDLNDIKEVFMIMTDDQRKIVMHIYCMYKKNIKINKKNDLDEICKDNPKILLLGPAGSGKSTIIDFIEKLITWEENKISNAPQKLKVLKCAFTGKAASNIDGVTLNYMFSLPIFLPTTRNLKKSRLNSKKELLKYCIFFICDEISMVGRTLMDKVDMRLKQIFDNNNLYGGRFVLLVGDLYQLDPVLSKPLYPESELWKCCEFYELTKIIRQQDEKFIKALNNFRDCQMTEQDIDLLKSREYKNIRVVPDSVIHLFYKNDQVDKFNEDKIDISPGEETTVNNVDDSDDWRPCHLRVKIGIRYMITANMDVGDGLANGTTGIVKKFHYGDDGKVDLIWMQFHSHKIGKKAILDYIKTHEEPGYENCVPIYRSSIVVKYRSDPKISKKLANAFPLKAAEAITVHKSQGQTYHDGVCIHLTDDKHDKLLTDKSLQYVALTRVKRLEDLYIIGTFNFSVKTNNRFKRRVKEMNRLRDESKLKLAFETFEKKIDDVIIFLNTELTFNEHYQFITTDKWYENGSLLIFTETNTIESDNIEIPNFEIAFRSDYDPAVRSGGGIICYKKASKSLKIITTIADCENKIYLTLLLYDEYLYIITGVKGNLNDDDFKLTLKDIISRETLNERCIFFIGDFNIGPNITPQHVDFFNDLNLRETLPCDVLTTNEDSHCDMVLTRNFDIKQNQIGFYEYIPSSHKPIYVMLPPKTQLMDVD